jgi:Cu-Zn family superoxide dismutase
LRTEEANVKTRFLLVALGSIGVMACGKPAEPPAAPEATPPAAEPPAPAPEPAATAAPAAEAAPAPAPAEAKPARILDVELVAKSGSKLKGKATLAEVPGGVKVTMNVEGVDPGDHGSHIHEKGDCSAADGASAGGHFNPGGHQHGLPAVEKRHLGDLGNITVGKDGKGTHEITISGANLTPNDPNSFTGRAIIIHAKKDDGGQPVGNAGGRIGCGVIGP